MMLVISRKLWMLTALSCWKGRPQLWKQMSILQLRIELFWMRFQYNTPIFSCNKSPPGCSEDAFTHWWQGVSYYFLPAVSFFTSEQAVPTGQQMDGLCRLCISVYHLGGNSNVRYPITIANAGDHGRCDQLRTTKPFSAGGGHMYVRALKTFGLTHRSASLLVHGWLAPTHVRYMDLHRYLWRFRI